MDALSKLADKYRTDKGLWHHGYTPIYNRYFEHLRDKPVKLLEIGIGGYQYPDKGGESLRMWGEYFANGIVTGMDIYPKHLKNLPQNANVICGNQTDTLFLSKLPTGYNIIIDDGSHVCRHVITSFMALFHTHLSPGGVYVVEDTETSYWAVEYGGGIHHDTTMNFFKALADNLNPASGKEDVGIESIHFHKGLIFIFKQ